MKIIAIEEHFIIQEHLESLELILADKYPVPEVAREEKYLERETPFLRAGGRGNMVYRLLDIGEGRIRDMDEAGIDMQVLSLVSPGVQVLDPPAGTALARKVNDKLAEAVHKYPERFAGLASIAPQDPEGAAAELERAVRELGLRGANINSHTKGEYLDNKKYWCIFEQAEKLDVPIYIHPRSPSPDMIKPYLDYSGLEAAVLGFAHETALHAMRLILGGVFDSFPGMKIILGHLGESLPYWLWRMDNRAQINTDGGLLRKPSQYIKDNFYITTSGLFWLPPLICAYLGLGADRIMFAIDYPMQEAEDAIHFINEAPLCDIDKEKILHLNAEQLLGL